MNGFCFEKLPWLIHFSFIALWLNNSTKQKMVIPKWSQSLKRPTWIEKIKVQQLCMYISTEWWQFQLQISINITCFFLNTYMFKFINIIFFLLQTLLYKKAYWHIILSLKMANIIEFSVKTFLQICVWKTAFWISKWAFCSSKMIPKITIYQAEKLSQCNNIYKIKSFSQWSTAIRVLWQQVKRPNRRLWKNRRHIKGNCDLIHANSWRRVLCHKWF